jgi:hypothetical protein
MVLLLRLHTGCCQNMHWLVCLGQCCSCFSAWALLFCVSPAAVELWTRRNQTLVKHALQFQGSSGNRALHVSADRT